MNPASTLTAYAAALAVVFGAALGVGQLAGPVGPAAASAEHSADGMTGMTSAGSDEHGDDHGGASTVPPVGGLAVAQDGYALQLARTVQTPGRPGRLQFAVLGPDGELLTDFERTHDKDLHLIVVRRDLTGFQHLHPERDAQGRWSVPLTLPEPGAYKVVADFTPGGREDPLALAADLTAPGPYAPVALPPAATTATVVDGYSVELEGELVAGTASRLALRVRRAGRPVTDLEPYLAAYGHLVALRQGDLAYLHTHPDADAADPGTPSGPEVVFYADVPAAGVHRLFLDFQHQGVVRTAAFTVTASDRESS